MKNTSFFLEHKFLLSDFCQKYILGTHPFILIKKSINFQSVQITRSTIYIFLIIFFFFFAADWTQVQQWSARRESLFNIYLSRRRERGGEEE